MNNLFIKIFGCRGSLPVSGRDYIIHGGDTTSVQIKTPSGRSIIVDAGTAIRRIGEGLINDSEIYIFFTHSHYDHIVGFPFFKPLFRSNTSITIYGNKCFSKSIESVLSNTMKPPFFPVPFMDIRSRNIYINLCKEPVIIDNVKITPVSISHPNGGVGYKFEYDGRSFLFLTDNELMLKHENGLDYEDYVNFCKNSDLIIHDAMYTRKEYRYTKKWGHSTFEDAVNLAKDSNTKKLIFFHHSPERTDRELKEIVSFYKKQASFDIEAAYQDMEIFL